MAEVSALRPFVCSVVVCGGSVRKINPYMSSVRSLTCFSGVIFLIYGVLCFYSVSMENDFHRFGLDILRVPTGVLELLGGSGMLIGLKWQPAVWISSTGLAVLMLIAFGIRMRMRDGVAVSLPSLVLMLLNLYILIKSSER
jgi:uncharacterized membrane protein YphA (DoxX/SURF4 family)